MESITFKYFLKFKYFLFFGLGGPIVNILVWFGLRHHDHGRDTLALPWLAGDIEETILIFSRPRPSQKTNPLVYIYFSLKLKYP